MRIAVGSENPVKIDATREAFELIEPVEEVESVSVPSGVSDQPTTDEEAVEGALNRARRALERTGADLGVGLEGSTEETSFGTFLTGWAAVKDETDRELIGGGGRLMLPPKVVERINEGKELGDVMDRLTGAKDVKRGPGAIGVFTNGIITRRRAYRDAIIFSLSRYIRPDLYDC